MKALAYLLQAVLISSWWCAMLTSSSFYDSFRYIGLDSKAFYAFILPDVLIVVIPSVLRAYHELKELEYLILGGIAFGTFYCIAMSYYTGGGYLSTTLMVLALCYNIFLVFNDRLFRKASTQNDTINGIKTSIQILFVWSITLVIMPFLIEFIVDGEIEKGNGLLVAIGIVTFLLFGIVGIYSAVHIVKMGKGTPLPLDQTNRLVTTGPYAWVRNPMALAGIGQGVAVALILGSVPILIYAVLGGIVWHVAVRPLEEVDMEKRFGEQYTVYKSRVPLWIPKVK